MATPYRTPAPQPPKPPPPRIPWDERYPIMKKVGTFLVGLAGTAGIVGVLWLLGWGIRAVGIVSVTDLAPNALAGLLVLSFIILAGMIAAGIYFLGVLITCKFKGEDFPD